MELKGNEGIGQATWTVTMVRGTNPRVAFFYNLIMVTMVMTHMVTVCDYVELTQIATMVILW